MRYKSQTGRWLTLCTSQPLAELVFLVCLASGFITMSAEQMEHLQAISESNMKFTTSIYQVLAKAEGNLFFSPMSIEVILALTYMGAAGNTAHQMMQGLSLPQDKENTKAGFLALMNSLTGVEHITLDIANKIFADTRVKLHDEFLSIAQKSFLSDIENVDFYKKSNDSRIAINKWVESKTKDRIKDLLQEGVVDSDTIMVLVNAVYFKGDWSLKFDPARTDKQPFYVTPTKTVDVDMMHIKKKFGYSQRDDLDCKVLEMRYAGEKLSMVILLPNELDGLARLEAKLPEVNLVDVLNEMGRPEVEVSLPKFKLEQSFDLKEVLQKLGMKDMFEDNADFSGLMKEGPPVKVSKVVHKAFIEVNEEGSEAAAATAVVMMCRMLPIIETFTADRPFVYFIWDAVSKSAVFFGRMSCPQ